MSDQNSAAASPSPSPSSPSSSHPRAIISPSLLSCDFALLAAEAQRMVKDGADWLHVDVMDGHFVPNLTLGAPIVGALRKHTPAYLDCHLMVTNPEQWVDDFAKAGANGYTFHIEATKDADVLIDKIHAKGMKAGIAVKPKTSVDSVFPYAGKADMILIMTVEPGFGGQSFMGDMMPKVEALRSRFPHLNIQVDGGITPANIDVSAKAGANVIVSGSGIFGAKEPAQAIKTMRDAIDHPQTQNSA